MNNGIPGGSGYSGCSFYICVNHQYYVVFI